MQRRYAGSSSSSRVDEISTDVDDNKRAAYFEQVQNGKYIRMALILALLEITDPLTGRRYSDVKVESIQNGVVIDHIPVGQGNEYLPVT